MNPETETKYFNLQTDYQFDITQKWTGQQIWNTKENNGKYKSEVERYEGHSENVEFTPILNVREGNNQR